MLLPFTDTVVLKDDQILKERTVGIDLSFIMLSLRLLGQMSNKRIYMCVTQNRVLSEEKMYESSADKIINTDTEK